MRENIKNNKEPQPQVLPGVRTRAQIINDIRRKRETGERFDEEESKIYQEQQDEDRGDRAGGLYGQSLN